MSAKQPSDQNPNSGARLPVLGNAPPATAREAAQRDVQFSDPPVVSFVSLGCAKNLVDSEMMLGQLVESGALISADEALADTVVVNTCGFLESSRTEALEIISELAERKRGGDLKRIVVAGCLVQRDGESLQDAVPEIDALVGVNNRADVVRAVWRMNRDEQVDHFLGDYHPQPWEDRGRLRLTPRHYGFVRVSEGCNQKCTFCTIPSIRGPMHSKTGDDLVTECRELIADGARELILIGQDTTSYGMDLPEYQAGQDQHGLAGLLRKLDDECVGADWIRLMYVYPSIMTDAMIDAIAASSRIVNYIDIPLQHISDRMLKRMARRVTRAETETLLEKLRTRIPDVAIRTTFIVGCPGETEQEFEELLQFVQEFGFDASGAFPYSLEPETPAGRMTEQLPAELIAERHERFMLTQQQVAFSRAKAWIGRAFDVVVDAVSEQADTLITRHAQQAPDVDAVSLLQVPAEVAESLPAGTVVRVRCVGTAEYDLVVELA